MRLLAAYLVLWSHQHALNGFSEKAIPLIGSSGTLGVYIFFAISGYLNALSIVRSRSIGIFITNRFLRIYPALAVSALFCVVLGAFVSRYGLMDYLIPAGGSFFDRTAPGSFLWRNSTLLFGIDYQLPGVFESNPYPKAVNGSLWTLPYEVRLYIFLAIACLLCGFHSRILAIVVFCGFAVLAISGLFVPLLPLWFEKYGTTFAIVFCSGGLLALVQVEKGIRPAFAVLAAFAALLVVCGHPETAALVAIAPICVALNYVRLPAFSSPKLDISYGVYLYAFPIQQLTANVSNSFWVRLVLAAFIATLLGILSAKLVEQPMLKLKRSRKPASAG